MFYWAGVGDHIGQIELSPLGAGNEGGSGMYGGSGQFVELLTIDSLELQDVSLLKIDVEEMEDQVLAGAEETILACRPVIIIEIMGGNNYGTATPDVRERINHTIETLESWDYRVTQLWAHDWLAIPQ